MYKNFNEMAAPKKGLLSEAVVPKKKIFFVTYWILVGNSFYQSKVFLYFTKVVAK